MNTNSSGKTIFVIVLFILFIVLLASGMVGSTDLTPDTPPAQEAAFAQEFNTLDTTGALPAAENQTILPQGASTSPCGTVYTVQSGDTLTRIAANCGVTVNDILAANPSITDPHVIAVGQQLVLYPGAAVPEAPLTSNPALISDLDDSKNPDAATAAPLAQPASSETEIPGVQLTPLTEDPYNTYPVETPAAVIDPYNPDPAVETVPTVAVPGLAETAAADTLLPEGMVPGGVIHVTIRGLPPTTPLSIGIGKTGDVPTMIEDRITDEQGELILRLAIPNRAQTGEEWVVTVMTMRRPVTTVKSVPFIIQ